MSTLVLTSTQADQIRREGCRAYPDECCGVIIGRDVGDRRLVEELRPLSNSFDTAERFHRFRLDPLELARAEKEAGAAGKLVLGFYHSHPDHPARPSEYDREHAWPFYSYVIVAIAKGAAADMTSWLLNESTEQFSSEAVLETPEKGGAAMSDAYANPQALVSTGWVAEHAGDPNVRIVEVDVDTAAYKQGHIQNAIGWNWQTDLNDRVRRDIIDPRSFAELNSRAGIANDHTVILYGDNNNWFAAWALWQYKYHGHRDVRLMNGGRKKWQLENRPLTAAAPEFPATHYAIPASDESIRAYRREVEEILRNGAANLVDVRSPDEFSGKVIAPPGMTETAQRGGHIPGARNIPWAKAVNEDGTFKSPGDLRSLYGAAGIDLAKPTIAYCRIGERSSHTWFVLKYLLGVGDVKNYDGSWTEWGNLVGAPIEVGATETAMPNVKCN